MRPVSRRHAARIAPLLLGVTAVVGGASPASAATIAVTTTADAGAGSLRSALAAAGSGDTVTVPAGTITLTSGELAVTKPVTIEGRGARETIISGGDASRVFAVPAANVTIARLTITKGASAQGAGVRATNGLTLSRVAIVANAASSSGGGASITGAGPATIDRSLIANNTAKDEAGGLSLSAGAGSSITNSTITGNAAGSTGGGFEVSTNGLTILSSTIYGNRLTVPGQGGNFRASSGADFSMGRTVLGGGIATTGGNCYLSAGSEWTSLGHNAEDTDLTPDQGGANTCQYYFDAAKGDRTKIALGLGTLANNGGDTDTLAPSVGSTLNDQVPAASCPTVDQRGVARPQGASCDVGAVERVVPATFSGFADTLTLSSAVLHGTADAQGLGGTAHYVYGPTPAFGAATPATPLAPTVGSQPVTAQLSGLLAGTKYFFALVVTTPDGVVTGSTESLVTSSVAPAPTPTPSATPTVRACKVPSLKGKTLAKARTALTKAGCKLGKVTRPKRKLKGTLVVVGQSPKAGKSRALGTKVAVTLGRKR